MKCSKCGYELYKDEYYIELENGDILDEICFFDMAVEKLNAKEKQNRIED